MIPVRAKSPTLRCYPAAILNFYFFLFCLEALWDTNILESRVSVLQYISFSDLSLVSKYSLEIINAAASWVIGFLYW